MSFTAMLPASVVLRDLIDAHRALHSLHRHFVRHGQLHGQHRLNLVRRTRTFDCSQQGVDLVPVVAVGAPSNVQDVVKLRDREGPAIAAEHVIQARQPPVAITVVGSDVRHPSVRVHVEAGGKARAPICYALAGFVDRSTLWPLRRRRGRLREPVQDFPLRCHSYSRVAP
jgi:hypothetical protein